MTVENPWRAIRVEQVADLIADLDAILEATEGVLATGLYWRIVSIRARLAAIPEQQKIAAHMVEGQA